MEKYDLPIYRKCRLNKKNSRVMIITSVLLIIFSLFILIDSDVMGYILGTIMLLFSVALLYMIIAINKRCFIEINDMYIKVQNQFKTYIAYWNEIEGAVHFSRSNNDMIGILLKKDIKKKTKKTVYNNINSLLGEPPISFAIPLMWVEDLDSNIVMNIIVENIENNRVESEEIKVVEEVKNNLLLAMIFSLMASMISAIVYISSIQILKSNYIIIPIITTFFIIAVFNRYYEEKAFNYFIRGWIGVLSLIQIPLGVIGSVIWDIRNEVTISNLWSYIKIIIQEIGTDKFNSIILLVVAIICFYIGANSGRCDE